MLTFLHTVLRLVLATVTVAAPVAYDCARNVTYLGIQKDGVEVFLSIPYGQDTGGKYRFQPPRPHQFKPGAIVDATVLRPACPQASGGYLFPLYLGNVTTYSEDCLLLNVARPIGTTAGSLLPVHVHIHGGSFIAGSKDEPTVQPGGLILQSVANGLPVIQVNFNYRLGVFGFAKNEALTEKGHANAGLRDQRLAIEWVRDHIAIFGGDPNQITVSGQSSGGLAVGVQLLSYGGRKPIPFQQAICQSQVLEPGITSDITDRAFARVVQNTSCDRADVQSQDTIACLRDLSVDRLLEAQVATINGNENVGDNWLPAVDGDFLPDAPSRLISQRRFANVTTMMGWCEDDTQFFVPDDIRTADDTRAFISGYVPNVTPANIDHLLGLYESSDFAASVVNNRSAEFFRTGRIMRDILMTCPPLFYGSQLASANNKVYLFSENQTVLTPLLHATEHPGVGVVHTSEFAYIFANLSVYDLPGYPYKPRKRDFQLARRQSRSWSTFFSTGRPSLPQRSTLQDWRPAFESSNDTEVYIIGGPAPGVSVLAGNDAKPAVAAQQLNERCNFINSPSMIEQIRY